MKNSFSSLILFSYCLFLFQGVIIVSASDSQGFLSLSTTTPDVEKAFIPQAQQSANPTNSVEPVEEETETSLSEVQIEDGEPGCFYRYAYGMNAKGYGLSLVSLSCPNPSAYSFSKGGCKVMGDGREYSSYSFGNFQYCSSQGMRMNDHHTVMAYVYCCSAF